MDGLSPGVLGGILGGAQEGSTPLGGAIKDLTLTICVIVTCIA